MQNSIVQPKTTPGVNPMVKLSHFTDEERAIIKRISGDWYVTNGGERIRLGKTSEYRYILIKPIDSFREMFNLDREIVLVFSPYADFEPRTLDAISTAMASFTPLRIERICSVLISKDPNIEYKLVELLKNDKEAQIVVPFTYLELSRSLADTYFFRNRFIEHFYARDLFASESPLKKDLYFFGRTDLVHSILNRHRSNQVSGLFGLRKTGKTSVVFGVQRGLSKVDGVSTFVDCQSPGFHKLRWNHALYYVLSEIQKQNGLNYSLGCIDHYTETGAAALFEEHLVAMGELLDSRAIMLIFDEIENITPTVSPSVHWRDGGDFVFFWQTIRSLFQKTSGLFSYLLVGTNPLCVELPQVGGVDNPIFAQVPIDYISGFEVRQTREMVRKLGKIMGLQFDETLYSHLTEDWGGHPYLIRHVCSVVHRISSSVRPIRVDKTLYRRAKAEFLKNYGQFLEMILIVLKEHFNDEFEMLKMLSCGDYEAFNEFAALSPLYTNHLVGYGILQEVDGRYDFQIETIKTYINSRDKYKKLRMTGAEMLAEISERRNALEVKLRKLCRMQLMSQYGEATACANVLAVFGAPRSVKLVGMSYDQLFDAKVSEIYFMDLYKLVQKYWDAFKHVLGSNKDEILSDLMNVNRWRADAHASSLTDAELAVFRLSAERLEKSLFKYFG